MSSVLSNGDFLLEEKHVPSIAIRIRNMRRMGPDWPVVSDFLLRNCPNGSIKDEIANLLKEENGVYLAVRLTLNTFIENQNPNPTFSEFIAAIPPEYRKLKSTLMADMEKIRFPNQDPIMSQPENNLQERIRIFHPEVRRTLPDVSTRKLINIILGVIFIFLFVIFLLAIFFPNSGMKPIHIPKQNLTGNFTGRITAIPESNVFHNETFDFDDPMVRDNCSEINSSECGEQSTTKKPVNETNATKLFNCTDVKSAECGNLALTEIPLSPENISLEMSTTKSTETINSEEGDSESVVRVLDYTSDLSKFSCAPKFEYTSWPLAPMPIEYINRCGIQEFTLLGTSSLSQLSGLLSTRMPHTLKIFNFTGTHACKNFRFEKCENSTKPQFETLDMLVFWGIGSECSPLFKYLGQCVHFKKCFIIMIDYTHLTTRSASDLHVLETKSCHRILYGENVTGVKIKSTFDVEAVKVKAN